MRYLFIASLFFSMKLYAQKVIPSSIQGDRLELSGFQVEAKPLGNYLTFQADPAISYFRYKICKNSADDNSCVQSSTVFQAIEIPASLGNSPTIQIWACITQAAAVDPKKPCTQYTLNVPQIQDMNGKRLDFLTQKEPLVTKRNQHAHEAFLAIYKYLSSNQFSNTCTFKGWNSAYTLDANFNLLTAMNPYQLDEAFQYIGYVPSDSDLDALGDSNNNSSTGTSSLELVNTTATEARPETWSEFFVRMHSHLYIPSNSYFYIPTASDTNPYFRDHIAPVGDDLVRLGTAAYQVANSVNVMLTPENPPPPEPSRGLWGYATSIPSLFASAAGYIHTAANVAEGAADIAKKFEALSAYPEFQPVQDLKKIAELSFSYEDLVRWKKLVNDPKFLELMHSFEELGGVLEASPEARAISESYLNMIRFLKSDEFKKLSENAVAIADILLKQGGGGGVKQFGSDMLTALRQLGLISQPFPKGWEDEMRSLLKGGGFTDDALIAMMSSLEKILANTPEKSDFIKEYRSWIRERFEIIRNLIVDPALREEIEIRMIEIGAMDPIPVNTVDQLNIWMSSFRDIFQDYTRQMTPTEWSEFVTSNQRLLNILGIEASQVENKSKMALGQMLQSKLMTGASLIDLWPPRTEMEARALTENMIQAMGNYTDNKEFWDNLYQNVIGTTSKNPKKELERAALIQGLKLIGIENGEGIYRYIFNIGNTETERGLLQGMFYNEYEVQQKIQEAIEKGIPPEERRTYAYRELWGDEALQGNIMSRIRNKFLKKLQISGQTPLLEALSKRLIAAYLPSELQAAYMTDALKAGLISYTNEMSTASPTLKRAETPAAPPHLEVSLVTPPASNRQSIRGLLSSVRRPFLRLEGSQNSTAYTELIYRNREDLRKKYANYFRIQGISALSMGYFASQLISSANYELSHSTGNCSDLKNTVDTLQISRTQIQSLQNQINKIDQQLANLH